MNNKIVAIIAVVIVVVGLFCCIAALLSGGAAFFLLQTRLPSPKSIQGITPTPHFVETIQTTPVKITPFSTPTAKETASNPNDTKEFVVEMEKIEQQVSALRGLSLSGEISRKFLSSEELRSRVQSDFLVDYNESQSHIDSLIMNLFGFVSRDFDFYQLYEDLYSEQIAGFYDDQSKEMVVINEGAFDGSARMTYAHEFTHALQDEAFGLSEGLGVDENHCSLESEYCAAVQALVEGDATLTESLWFLQNSTLQDKKDVLKYYDQSQSPIYDSMPTFLQEDFMFAYDRGFTFVQALYEEGGMEAINAAYANPPLSTEQILHPERYPKDKPQSVDAGQSASSLLPGWKEIDRNSLGEWYTYLLLSKPGDSNWAVTEDMAAQAAEGWGGDQYVVYYNLAKDQVLLVYLSQWDTDLDAREFWIQLSAYGDNRWSAADINRPNYHSWQIENEFVAISRSGNRILWILAPDSGLRTIMEKQFPDFSVGD